MQIIHNLEDYRSKSKKIHLTIGNFDALHLGHQSLLQAMQGGEVVLLTFTNHPQTVLSDTKKPFFLSLPHKLHLLKNYGVDAVCLLPFTKELSQQSAEEFLRSLQRQIPFTSLILGYDARIGRNREGDEKRLKELSKSLNFNLIYHPPLLFDTLPISTSRIRDSLQKGDFSQVTALLGRPYSIRGTVQQGSGRGKALGFCTMNLQVMDLSLPPLGVYGVDLFFQDRKLQAVANLGLAPTVRQSLTPLLEVHVPGFDQEIYGEEVEVIFRHFIREERRFLSLDELKSQITRDIKAAQK